jgi:hypothetical protein
VARKSGLLFTAAVIALSTFLLFAGALPVSGFASLGCSFDEGLFPSLSYEFNSVESHNQTAFNSAQGWWDGDTSPTTYFVSSWGDVNVEVYDKWDYSSSASAWWSYGCTGGVFSSHEGGLTFNEVHMPSASYAKAVVATHELGHAYGLGHQSMSCSSTARVMEQGSEKWGQSGNCASHPPWSDDVNGWAYYN